MTPINRLSNRENKVTEAMVNGLFWGMVAGLGMAVYLGLAAISFGESPLGVLGRFDPSAGGQPWVGLIAHLAVSAIYGAFFGLLSFTLFHLIQESPGLDLVSGVGYGALLFILARYFLLPDVGSPLLGIPGLHFGLGHLVYGLILGWFAARA